MAARPPCSAAWRRSGLPLRSRSIHSPAPISRTCMSCSRCSSQAHRVPLCTCAIFVTKSRRKAQYISNKGHGYRLRQVFGALGSSQDDDKIGKALLWSKGFRRRESALLGLVLVVDLLELAAVEAQVPLG